MEKRDEYYTSPVVLHNWVIKTVFNCSGLAMVLVVVVKTNKQNNLTTNIS